ncbi:MAG: hypothetical protein KGH64_05280 [Candidatus Micrarchaeota archaeon]|nr:hypothetical protein [Candidatus Micrarchaeota archaeon]
MNDSEIATWLGVSQGYFSKMLKWARNKQRNNQGITKDIPRNKSSSSHIPSPLPRQALSPKPLSTPIKPLKLRLHRLQRTYQIQNAVSETRLRALKINDKLNNITQWLGAGFRLIRGKGWTLEIEGMELIADYTLPVAITEGLAYTLTDNLAKRLAAQYGFIIAKEGHTPPTLTEYELNAVQVTERLKKIQKGGVVELYADSQGYKIWADWSFGIGGLESNNLEYEQRLMDIAKDIAEKDAWNVLRNWSLAASERLDRIEKIQERTEARQEYYAKNMESHARMIEFAVGMVSASQKEAQKFKRMFEKASQKRLFE